MRLLLQDCAVSCDVSYFESLPEVVTQLLVQ